jgi:hypothetical protein
MYLCVEDISFTSFYDLFVGDIGFTPYCDLCVEDIRLTSLCDLCVDDIRLTSLELKPISSTHKYIERGKTDILNIKLHRKR